VIGVLATFALREALRRRVFAVVAVLSVGFLALYALGVWQAFDIADDFGGGFRGIDAQVVTGATMFGLSMFGTLFLGAVLGVFLTLGVVRGDAERGLLQPVLARPVSRDALLGARLLAAGAVCGGYTLALYCAAMAITGAIGGWWPDRPFSTGLSLALAVIVLSAISLAGSVVMSAAANGIAVFMTFGAGLTAGLLGQIGRALNSDTLTRVSDVTTWLLPFEALYQSALADLTAETVGFTRFALQLGPLGGAREGGPLLYVWAIAYVAVVMVAAAAAFRRRDV